MRVALTLSGQARSVEEIYPEMYYNLIKDNNVDVFIHTWKSHEYDKIGLYKPKYLKIDDPSYEVNKFNIINHADHGNWDSVVKMHASLYEVGKLLKSSNESYDIVIRERFEHIVENPYDLNFILEKIKEGNVVIPNPYCNAGGYNDQIAFGSMDNMLKYFDTYNNIQTLLDKGTKAHPETILKASLDMNDIKVYQYQHNFFDTYHPPLYHKYFKL